MDDRWIERKKEGWAHCIFITELLLNNSSFTSFTSVLMLIGLIGWLIMTTFMIKKETEKEEIDRRRIIDRYVSTYSTINLRGEREREKKRVDSMGIWSSSNTP